MKNLISVILLVLSINSFSQCEWRYFAPWEYDIVIEEEWDNNQSILHRKYYSKEKDTVDLYYVNGCSFTQKENTIDYQDEETQFFQSYLTYEDCYYLISENHEVYTRTYTLPSEQWDVDLEETVFTEVRKVVVFSRHKDFRVIHAITFYEDDIIFHHYIF